MMAGSAAMAQLPGSLAHSNRSGSQTGIPFPRRKAQMLSLDGVQLDNGPFREAMERNGSYVLSLIPDKFLYYFRTTAGLPPKSEAYGGWEKTVGRMLGHYLSACSMYFRATGRPEFQQRQNYVVDELSVCQRAHGNGYVGGVPGADRIFREIAAGNIYIDKVGLNGVHAPWYMLHKMCAGLRDAYAYGGNTQALTVLTGFSDWAWTLTEHLSDASMQKMLEDEHGGMNEVLAELYAITRNEKYLSLSQRFNHRSVLEPLTRGVDDLDGLHANTQIPTAIGLYSQYEVTGDAQANRGGEFFWQAVTRNRSYVIGGDSEKEHFYPVGQMGQKLSPATAETCNSYNMVKLTDRLFANNPSEELAAYQERVLWNHILASQDKATPGMTYFMSLQPGHFKTFSSPIDSFWCCVGTGIENHAKYGESVYFSSAHELWINQFIASRVIWKERGMQLVQTTAFPFEPRSQWKVVCKTPVEAEINLRHPKWAGDGFAVTINGKRTAASDPGSYLKLRRRWTNGDVIAAALPMQLSVEPMHDDRSWNAILYGPIVLAGLLGSKGMPPAGPYAAGNQLEFQSVPDPRVPALTAAAPGINEWLKKIGPLEFVTSQTSTSESVHFVPLSSVTKERYSVYWKLSHNS
jgi:DUF1680 family protein